MTDQPSESLRALAAAHGVATDFWSFDGQHRDVSAATVRAALTALGVPHGDDETNWRSLTALDEAPWRRTLPPSVIMRAGQDRQLPVHVPDGAAVRVTVRTEQGQEFSLEQLDIWVPPREVDGQSVGRATFLLPGSLPLGWHTLMAEVDGAPRAQAVLAVTPDRLEFPALRHGRGWGVTAQVYSVRSRHSWGFGDVRDMAEVASFFGDLGADFLLTNPLHATAPVSPITPSPYLPDTRRFVNPIYIRPEDIEEVAYLTGPQRALVEWAAEEVRPLNTRNAVIDRDAVWQAKNQALEVIFAQPRSRARQRDFERFCEEQGQPLADFALWCALTEKFDGKEFPEQLSSAKSPFVARQRRELADRVEYFCWLQWIVDQQLARAQAEAKAAGMGLGIMQDLAVGVSLANAESWSNPDVFASGMSVGAPPDMYNQQGQDWGEPPWRPDALAEAGYQPLRDMVRAVLRHAGALRIDHIIGLFRLWWVPAGMGPTDGTYVRYDHEAMVGVLLLEAQRAGAVVIGEDLGTVEPWVRDYLASRGILGTSVLWFEKDGAGYPIQAADFREPVLATVTTHDLPPTAGYLAGEHVDLRVRLGLLTQPEPEVRADANRERARMVGRLQDYLLLGEDPTEREIIEALHRYVAMGPSRLVGVALTDAVGERRTQNQPGTDTEYPNWKLPLADGADQVVLVEDLPTNARLLSLVEALTQQMQGGMQ